MIDASVPLLWHIATVLALLASNASLFYVFKRKTEALQAALVAKKVLLGPTGVLAHDQHLLAGETLTFKDDKGNRLEITTTSATHLDVKVYAK